MKRNRFFTAIGLITAVWFSACTNDELVDNNTLPEGKYPLEIASVTMSVESSSEPWNANAPQTRVTESENGNSSVWETGDVFYVKFEGSDKVGTYKITDAETGTVEAVKPVYWRSASEAQTIIAWYASQEGGTIDVSDQTSELAYLIRAELKATCNGGSPVFLQFSHQLSKVRVYLRGTAYEGKATGVTLSYPASYTMTEGSVTQTSGTNGTIQMHKADNADYYEALVIPGTIAINRNPFTVTLNGTTTANVNLSASLTLATGSKHDVTLRVHKQGTVEVNLSEQSAPYEIKTDSIYYFYNSGSYGIKVTSGNPNIYLGDATINVSSGNAIDITNGSPTIHVQGNNTVSTSEGAGIFVAENNTVTITGSSRSDVLTVTGNEGSSGIGGYVINDSNYQSANSGNINIKNVTIYAYSSSQSLLETVSPGIGSTGGATCQSIIIDNATVHAYGCGATNLSAPAIGNGVDWIGGTASSTPTVTISNNSEVHAHRGERNGRSFADYIGRAGHSASPYSDVIATVDASSVVYKYTGNTPEQ